MNGSRSFTDKEIKSICSHLSLRNKTIFIIGIRCGLRISEITTLQKNSVLNTNGTIKNVLTVEKKNVKGKFCGRTLPMHEDVVKVLKEYLGKSTNVFGVLFPGRAGKPLNRTVFHKALAMALSSAGINNNDGKTSSHGMRKTFAQKFYKDCNKNIHLLQKALGHRNINSTTQYMDVDMEEIFNIIKNMK